MSFDLRSDFFIQNRTAMLRAIRTTSFARRSSHRHVATQILCAPDRRRFRNGREESYSRAHPGEEEGRPGGRVRQHLFATVHEPCLCPALPDRGAGLTTPTLAGDHADLSGVGPIRYSE